MYLTEFIVKWACQGLKYQDFKGALPAGHNGPWNNIDTPVRNTAHWALIFYRAYEISSSKKFYDASILACDYLISKEVRPYNKTFHCRKSHVLQNEQNGLVGQVWALEPLISIGKKTNNNEYLKIALEIIALHEYDFKKHGWINCYINGELGKYNYTVNQQIWFGMMSSELAHLSSELKKRVDDFLLNFHKNILFHQRGLIKHVNYEVFDNTFVGLGKKLKRFFNSTDKEIYMLSMGYQSFILYTIARTISDQKKIEDYYPFYTEALNFISDKNNLKVFQNNPFCFAYNVTGFELAYVFDKLGDTQCAEWWLKEQFKFSFKRENKNLVINKASDERIMGARLYEILEMKKDYLIF